MARILEHHKDKFEAQARNPKEINMFNTLNLENCFEFRNSVFGF